MKNRGVELTTVIALLVNLVGVGLGPLPAAAAPVPVQDLASLGALPAWFAEAPALSVVEGPALSIVEGPAGSQVPRSSPERSEEPAQPTVDGAVALAQPADPETYTDDAGWYRFEDLPLGTHKVTLDQATLPPRLRPPAGEAVPVVWLTPGMGQTSGALSTGVRFTAAYEGEGGVIAGVVFLDRDGDGQQGTDEPGLPGVRVVDPTVHQYFVPFDDRNLWTLFYEKNQCHFATVSLTPTVPLISYVFLTAGSDGTTYYYDHWEDGYDADPLNPGAAASTEIGILDAGITQIFQSDIDPTAAPWPLPAPPYYYDGRDRITIFGEDALVVRMAYPDEVENVFGAPVAGVLSAAAWEVPEAAKWGTRYVATVGEDLDFNTIPADDHDYAGLEVMAWNDGTQVYYNGTLVTPVPLSAGQTYFVDGSFSGGTGVRSDDVITATAPVQVQMMTGSCNGNGISAHGYTLQPVGAWGTAYWAPVPSFPCEADLSDTDIYLHNPHAYAIDITVSSDQGTLDIVGVPANTTISVLDEVPWTDISTANSAVRLSSAETFWGMAVIDSSTNSTSDAHDYDWGYVLIPESELSGQVVIGYAPGNAAGPPPTDNGNLAFVTAVTDTTIYVDLNQDGLADPVDLDGDGFANTLDVYGIAAWDEPLSALGVPLAAGQVLRVGDPNDRDLMGARIYTPELEEDIAVAWGQDPCAVADVGAPYLDLGYTVLPPPIPRLSKVDELAVDADVSGSFSPGDTLTYTVLLHNNGLNAMRNVTLTDYLPYTYTDFAVGSLRVTTPPPTSSIGYSNDGVDFTAPENPDIQAFRITWPLVDPGQTVSITFRVILQTYIPITVAEITNQALVESDNTDPTWSEDPDDPPDPDTDTPVGRPLLSMDKQVNPTVVSPGDFVTYTVVVSNYGGGVAFPTTISDVLPSWLTYVPGTLDLTWPIAQVRVTSQTVTRTTCFHDYYADDFDLSATETTTYTGNDGSLSWTGPWTEVGDDGLPGSGDVQVRSDGNALSAPGYLWMEDTDGADAGVVRTVDLSQFLVPWLRYYISGTTSAGGDYRVEAEGVAVQTEQYNGPYTVREIDLSTYAGNSAVDLGFIATGGLDAGEYYRFDHISIYETDQQRVTSDTITWESVLLSYTTSTDGDPVSYDAVTGLMVITQGMRLPAGGFVTATFQAQVATPLTDGLTLVNVACVTATNWVEILSPPCDDAAIQVESSHGLTVTKSADPSPVEAGSLLTYTIHYTITGDEAVEHVFVSDTTPVSTTLWDVTPAPITPPAPYPGYTGPVVWQVSGLWPPGSGITRASGTLTMVVLVDSPLVSGTLIHNAVFISDTTGLTDTDDVTTPVMSWHDLVVTKTADPSPVAPGGWLTYTIAWAVTGNEPAPGVTISDTTPVSTTFWSASPPPVTAPAVGATGPVVWFLGDQNPPASGVVTMVVRLDGTAVSGTVLYNTVLISDTTGLTDTDDVTTPVMSGHDLVITKTAEPSPVAPGGWLTYTIAWAVTGNEPAPGVTISDTTPVSTTFWSASPPPVTAPAVGDTGPVVWFLGDRNPPASGVVTMVVRVDGTVVSGTVLYNAVFISDTTGLTDTDDVTTPVMSWHDLVITKTAEPSPVAPGGWLTYTIAWAVMGNEPAPGVTISDTTPVSTTFWSASPPPVTAPAVGGTGPVVWFLGDQNPPASGVVTMVVRLDGTVVSGAVLSNTVLISDTTGLTDTDDIPVFVEDPAVVVDKRVADVDYDFVQPNYVTFTIVITNVGPSTIDVLPLADVYESYYLSFVDATPYPEEDADDGFLNWYDLTGPAPYGFDRNLPPGQSFAITTVFRVVHNIITPTVNTAIISDVTDVYGNPANDDDDDADVGNVPTPVELLYWRAVAQDSAIRLEWATAAEVDNVGFYVYRALDESVAHAHVIAFVPASGSGSSYSHVDRDVTPGQRYWYWLADLSASGSETFHGPVWGGVGVNVLRYRFYLPLIRKITGE